MAVTIQGETHTIREWADRTGIGYETLRLRVTLGWPEERLLSPVANTGRFRPGEVALTRPDRKLLDRLILPDGEDDWFRLVPRTRKVALRLEAAGLIEHCEDSDCPGQTLWHVTAKGRTAFETGRYQV